MDIARWSDREWCNVRHKAQGVFRLAHQILSPVKVSIWPKISLLITVSYRQVTRRKRLHCADHQPRFVRRYIMPSWHFLLDMTLWDCTWLDIILLNMILTWPDIILPDNGLSFRSFTWFFFVLVCTAFILFLLYELFTCRLCQIGFALSYHTYCCNGDLTWHSIHMILSWHDIILPDNGLSFWSFTCFFLCWRVHFFVMNYLSVVFVKLDLP